MRLEKLLRFAASAALLSACVCTAGCDGEGIRLSLDEWAKSPQ